MSAKLEKAREYEERKGRMIPDSLKPFFHLIPRTGWMNDPNGFSFYGGKYHLFYQYYPYDTCWGSMHWGHAVSTDLLRWEYLPAALAPDEAYDEFGCFSGGAVVTEDGKHMIVYTGVRKEEDEFGETHDIQTQCVAIGDGLNYEKYEYNPVIDEDKLPEGAEDMISAIPESGLKTVPIIWLSVTRPQTWMDRFFSSTAKTVLIGFTIKSLSRTTEGLA